MAILNREFYVNKLNELKNNNRVKVLTGIKRSGKSTIMDLFINSLLSNGISENNIIKINFKNASNIDLDSKNEIISYINSKIQNVEGKKYLFLDEINLVYEFEKVISILFNENNNLHIDFYISGLNSKMILSKIINEISDENVSELKIYPLSFSEYYNFYLKDKKTKKDLYKKFIQYGSFPALLNNNNKDEIKIKLEDLINSIILNDIVEYSKVSSTIILKKIIEYFYENIGVITTDNKITNALNATGNRISSHTADNYIKFILNAFIVYEVKRYDPKFKKILSSGNKYYASDLGIKNFLYSKNPLSNSYLLENIVCLELLKHNYNVYVGTINWTEISFVAIKNNEVKYYQIIDSIKNNERLYKEQFKSLLSINDNYPKCIITNDEIEKYNEQGIEVINVIDWLLEQN